LRGTPTLCPVPASNEFEVVGITPVPIDEDRAAKDGRWTQRCFFRPQSPTNIEAVQTTIPIRMHRLAAVAATGITVASCAGTIKERMAKFEGLPLSAAIAKIGEPIDERTNAGRKVYIWGSLGTVNKGEKGKCQITATMDGDVIASVDYQGDETLCQRYAARLRP
jgi:hypothetical protein